MKVTIELDSYADKVYLDKIDKDVSYKLYVNPSKFELPGLGLEGYLYLNGHDIQLSSSSTTITLQLQSCPKPKSKEEVAAEVVVAKAKEALKAAEASLATIKAQEEY